MALLLVCFFSCGSLLLLAGLVRGHPEGAVRLSGGFQQKSGLVEVLINGSWIPVAQEVWTRENAEVVCRQLGYAEVAGLLGAGDLCPIAAGTEFVVGGVNCSGEESTISECMYTILAAKGLNNSPSGVICADDGDARLVNTTRPGSGIVEILQDGTWTSIESTTTSFDPNELCRQLGFEQGSQINVSVNSTELISSGSGTMMMFPDSDLVVMLECVGPPPPPCTPLLSSLSCDSISVTTDLLSSHTTTNTIRHRQSNSSSLNQQPWSYTTFFPLNQSDLPAMSTIDQLCPAMLYEIQVQSLNTNGPSGSLLVRTPLLELPIPNNISVSVVSFSSANITWTVDQTCGNSFVTGYEVVVISDQNDNSSAVLLYQLNQPTTSNGTSSILLSDLQPSTTYSIQVRSLSDNADTDCDIPSTISSFSSSVMLTTPLPDVQLNSTLQPYLTDKSGEVLLTATWQLACQQSIDCDALVDSLVLRCRGAGDVIEGRSQCDDVMSEGDVSVMGRELSQYQCNITAFSIDGITLATNVINVSTPQSVPSDFKVVNISQTTPLLKWNYSVTATPILGFRISISTFNEPQLSRQVLLLNSSTLGEGPTYSYPIGQLSPGRMYEINLAVTTSNGAGPNTTIWTRTTETAPFCSPRQLTPNTTTNSTTITFTWTPPTTNASCTDDSTIGYIVHCSLNMTALLSYTILSPSSRNYTLTLSREDARHYGHLTCHVTRFNSAGESPASNRVEIEFDDVTDTPQLSFLNNSTVSLAFFVILLVLVVIMVLMVVTALLACVVNRHRQRILYERRRMRRISQAQPGRPSDDIYHIYQVGEPIEQSYIPMASTTSLMSRNNQRNSLWIDMPETPQASSFMPIIENPAIATHQRTASDAASVGREIDASESNERDGEKKEEDDYDEVSAQLLFEMRAVATKTAEVVTDDENLYDEIIPKLMVSQSVSTFGVEISAGGAESSQTSNIIPPPTEFAVLPRRTSLPTVINTQTRHPPPRRPTVGAKPSRLILVIPSNNHVTVDKNDENGSTRPKEVEDDTDHYSIPCNRPLLTDPNMSPQYEVVLNPEHLALLLKNDSAIEQEKEEKTSIATES